MKEVHIRKHEPSNSLLVHIRNLWLQWHQELPPSMKPDWEDFVQKKVNECEKIISANGVDPYDGANLHIEAVVET